MHPRAEILSRRQKKTTWRRQVFFKTNPQQAQERHRLPQGKSARTAGCVSTEPAPHFGFKITRITDRRGKILKAAQSRTRRGETSEPRQGVSRLQNNNPARVTLEPQRPCTQHNGGRRKPPRGPAGRQAKHRHQGLPLAKAKSSMASAGTEGHVREGPTSYKDAGPSSLRGPPLQAGAALSRGGAGAPGLVTCHSRTATSHAPPLGESEPAK